jgi:predicted ATP-dependent serine protease
MRADGEVGVRGMEGGWVRGRRVGERKRRLEEAEVLGFRKADVKNRDRHRTATRAGIRY